MHIKEKILELHRSSSEYTPVKPLLNGISIDLLDKIVDDSTCDTFLENRLKQMEAALDGINISHGPKWKDLYSLYKEMEIYLRLKSSFIIEAIPETDHKTPDFCIQFRGEKIFAELKTLLAMYADLFYKSIDEAGLDAAVKTETELINAVANPSENFSPDKIIIFSSEIVVAPHRKDATYDPRSKLHVIKNIINKFAQNFKREQYACGNTISIIDITQLGLISPLILSLLPIHKSLSPQQSIAFESGELWNIAFGVQNQILFRQPEFNGCSNYDSNLTENGIMNDYPDVKGILFHSSSNYSDSRFVGIHRSNENRGIIDFFKFLCKNACNDEKNSNFYFLHANQSHSA
ncbi:MAG: hypothetical protein OEZ01_16720 [Candidatus Heimdallarchaeota archaeon]|nr:hypothetical protein [Candidatus Heimdallarchaeota archaeon]